MKDSNAPRIKISIIGSGVVGFATGKGFAAKGLDVSFIDTNKERIDYIKRLGFEASTPKEALQASKGIDVHIFTVPTPTENGRVNTKYLEQAAQSLGERIKDSKEYQIIVTRSTVTPGTTRNLVIPIVESASQKIAGTDFGVCMNPEYLREESAVKDFESPWAVTIGELDARSGNALEQVYSNFGCPIYRVGLEEAEMQKYVHNLFNAVKISYYNEMRAICVRNGWDAQKIFEITSKSCEGMWNTTYGTKDKGPYGGSCLPKDTQAFRSWAEDKKFDIDVLKAAIAVNERLLKQFAR